MENGLQVARVKAERQARMSLPSSRREKMATWSRTPEMETERSGQIQNRF